MTEAKRAEKKHRNKRRRAAIRHAIFTRAPVRLLGRRFGLQRAGKDFHAKAHAIPIDPLPDSLQGLRVTHLSDPHVGELVTPDHLPSIIDATNDLNGDIIAVTGDLIDFSNKFLPPVIEAVKRLEAPLGVYFVLGNHDYLDNGAEVKHAFASAGLNLLLNQTTHLKHKGSPISIGGVDWTESQRTLARNVRETCRAMDQVSHLNILLAHHPHAFDSSQRYGVHLTLSGHTHGGQMILSRKRGKKGSIGLANLGFRYTRGLYSRGNSHLFVSSGVGSWFPYRFRCPAEINSLVLGPEQAS